MSNKKLIVRSGLGVLGLAMAIIGAIGGLIPPILTGIGFGLIA